jgi:CubicO group peptidase (beta-lactamase class C family)
MRKLFSIFFLLSVGVQCIAQVNSEQGKAIETLFNKTVEDTQFSGVLLVAVDGKPIYFGAKGMRDFSKKIPLQSTDIFELASVSKQFTAMVIMILKEQGKLNYDDAVEKYVSIPYKGITIRHLLNHTSGLPDYQDIMDKYWDKSKVAGNEDCVAYLNKYAPPVLFAPGTKYTYSNTGYLLLASIAEKVSGQEFIAFCRENIFSHLGMKQTNIRTNTEKAATPNFALGHIKVDNRYVRADSFPSSDYTIWLGNRKGPGRISSTASDLLLWDQALYANSLVKHNTLAEAFTPAILTDGKSSAYGFGWMISTDASGNKLVFHTGDNPGYHTQIRRYLTPRITIILLSNNNSDQMENILDGIALFLQLQKE